MKTEIEKEIQELIAQKLPAQVGEVLKQRLFKAENDEKVVEDQAKVIASCNKEIAELRSKIDEYKKFDMRNENLEVRERDASERERNLKISTLDFQIQAEREKAQFAKEVALGLVRNTEYRSSVFNTKSVPVNNNGYVSNHLSTDTKDETTKAE